MSDDLERTLRKALDEADRYRKRVVVMSSALALTVAGGLFTVDHFRQMADIGRMVLFGVATLLIGQVAVAVVTWGVMVESTRKTLKAIELMNRD